MKASPGDPKVSLRHHARKNTDAQYTRMFWNPTNEDMPDAAMTTGSEFGTWKAWSNGLWDEGWSEAGGGNAHGSQPYILSDGGAILSLIEGTEQLGSGRKLSWGREGAQTNIACVRNASEGWP